MSLLSNFQHVDNLAIEADCPGSSLLHHFKRLSEDKGEDAVLRCCHRVAVWVDENLRHAPLLLPPVIGISATNILIQNRWSLSGRYQLILANDLYKVQSLVELQNGSIVFPPSQRLYVLKVDRLTSPRRGSGNSGWWWPRSCGRIYMMSLDEWLVT